MDGGVIEDYNVGDLEEMRQERALHSLFASHWTAQQLPSEKYGLLGITDHHLEIVADF
jgi:hypothetical protein